MFTVMLKLIPPSIPIRRDYSPFCHYTIPSPKDKRKDGRLPSAQIFVCCVPDGCKSAANPLS